MARNELIDETGQLLSDPANRALRVNVVAGGAAAASVVQQGAKDATAQPWLVDGSGVVQPVSAAALPLPAGASTEATLALIKTKTDNLDVALSTRAVTGLTDAQLRASAVPVSAATLPLPAGASVSALQTTGNASLGNIDTSTAASKTDLDTLVARTPVLGQALAAASSPVVLASDQPAIPTSLSGNVTVVGATATGVVPTTNPVLTGGIDSFGQIGPIPLLSRTTYDEPRDQAVAVRSPNIEILLAKIAMQNDLISSLLQKLVSLADPMVPTAMLQIDSSVVPDGFDYGAADGRTPIQ